MSSFKLFSSALNTAEYCAKSTIDFVADHAKTYSFAEIGKVKVLNEKIKHLTAVLDFAKGYDVDFLGLKELYANSKLTKKTITVYHWIPQLVDDFSKLKMQLAFACKTKEDQQNILNDPESIKSLNLENSFRSGWFELVNTITNLFSNFLSGLKEFLLISGVYIKDSAIFVAKVSPVTDVLGGVCGAISLVDAANDCFFVQNKAKPEGKKYYLTLSHKLLKVAENIMKLSISIIPLIKVYVALLPAVAASVVVSPALIPTISIISIVVGLVVKYIKKHADAIKEEDSEVTAQSNQPELKVGDGEALEISGVSAMSSRSVSPFGEGVARGEGLQAG